MEAISNPLYDKCKKIVKIWEYEFKTKNGRPPSKLDIREADKNVRDAYSTYFKLKTAALEESLLGVLDEDNPAPTSPKTPETNIQCDVISNITPERASPQLEPQNEVKLPEQIWGEHLNKPANTITDKLAQKRDENLNSSFAKKLFANSKFSKRNPRKSMLNQSESTPNQSLSQPECTASLSSPVFSFNSSLRVASNSQPVISQSINLFTNKSVNVARKIDKGWLARVTKTVDSNLSKSDLSDDDIISDSDTEENSIFHPAKRLKLSPTYDTITFPKPEHPKLVFNITSLETTNASNLQTPLVATSNSIQPLNTPHTPQTLKHTPTIPKITNTYQNPSTTKTKTINTPLKPTTNTNQIDHSIQPDSELTSGDKLERSSNHSSSDSEPKKVVRKRKRIITKPKTTKVSDRPARKPRAKKLAPTQKSDDESELQVKTTRIRKPHTKQTPSTSNLDELPLRKTRSNTTELPPDLDAKPDDYELEYSKNPPPATVPRFTNVLQDITVTETSKTVSGAKSAKTKLEKKIAAGTLNENFVRIDIKKKVYVRGKKSLNFTKYKKQQWKNKRKALHGPEMDMGGCDGGAFTCFKCGQSGHIARQCKAKLYDALLPLEAFDENECELPSLADATKMAKDNVCAVRTPNLIPQPPDRGEYSGLDTNLNDLDEFGDDEDLEQFIIDNDFDDESSNIGLNSQDLSQFTQTLSHNVVDKDVIRPLYGLNHNRSLLATPKEVYVALQQFGHDSFRPGQEQAVMRILSGLSTLVTLSTGSGKSLCYQLPAYLYAKYNKCISLIISPLVSLMEDQVSSMSAFLKAGCLHTSQTTTQREKVMKLIETGDLDILLISPEAVTAGEKKTGFGSLFRKLPPIAFACIDEAHCVSQWSHNFRPSYLVLCRVLREKLGIRTVLGLTATSTHATSTSIVKHLQIPDGREGVISDIPLPDNLLLSVSCDQQRDGALRALLGSKPFDTFDSVIIYCTRREECERIAAYLRTSIRQAVNERVLKRFKSLSYVAEPYHAGLAASKRRTVQNAFMCGYLRIVVATVAFGMGINKADIRAVIHYNMPRNFESYVQEVGRAGRDGLPAQCHLFLDSEGRDQNELKRHIYANSMDRHAIRKLLQKIFVACGCKGICPRHEVAFSVAETVEYLDVPEENISTLLCYLELHEKRYLEVLTPVYINCKIISYGGPAHIKKAGKDCAPLAMALALHKDELKENVFEFPVVDVAAAMGWDSGMVKSKLKNLEWTIENVPKRSTLTIEFSNLGFHLRAPGNLPPTELDGALDSLFAKKKEQEQTSLLQLQAVHSTLTSVAEKSYQKCLDESYSAKSTALKTRIREYFSCEQPLKDLDLSETQTNINEAQVIADIRNLTAMYRDTNFTGRAVARIFHGIQSPNYPAIMWGRCKYWRAHLNSDFNRVCQIATAEMLKLR